MLTEEQVSRIKEIVNELDKDQSEIASLCQEVNFDYTKVRTETDKYEEGVKQKLGVEGHMSAVNYLRHMISDSRSVLIEDSGKIKSIMLCARRIDKNISDIKKMVCGDEG